MTTAQIVERLNQLKKSQGITLVELSRRSGVSQGTVNKIMSGGARKINGDKLNALCNALGVAPFQLQASLPPLPLGIVSVACISPEVRVCDVDFNCDKIIKHAKQAAKSGIKLALFPELCITGYSCDDLFFQSTLRKAALDGLMLVTEELSCTDIIAVVGLPINDSCGSLYNAAAVLYRGKVLGVVPKSYLPNYNEFYEKRIFTPAFDGNTTINLFGYDVPFGTRLIFADTLYPDFRFAIEICEDVWVAESPSYKHAEAGATVILNLSASNETVCKADYRRKMLEIQSGKTCSAYMYASSAPSESTSSTVFSAHNIICENGEILAESEPFGDGYARADIDVDFIANERTRLKTKQTHDYLTVPFCQHIEGNLLRVYDDSPFVPKTEPERSIRCERAMTILAYGLKKRIEHTKAAKLVIGVSGGTDSALALLTCANALKLLKRKPSNIISVIMPCFGTTDRTRSNAYKLAEALGTTIREVNITKAVTQHLTDIGHDLTTTDTTYENAQARERTQVLMDIANQVGGLVIGTGDMSELALGWATFNGDHMSMYGVNAGVPKTLVRAMLSHRAAKNDEVGEVLQDIIDTPISPELLPPQKNKIMQVTEDIVGPYDLHDYFLFMLVRKGFTPSKIFALAQNSFDGVYDKDTIYKWLRVFIRRFFSQQFKRSCSPDSVKLGSVDISKYGHRMPSDGCPESWLTDLDNIYNIQ